MQFKDWICVTLNISIWVEVNLDTIELSWEIVKFCIKSFGIFCICVAVIFFNNTLGILLINCWISVISGFIVWLKPELFDNFNIIWDTCAIDILFTAVWSIWDICSGDKFLIWSGDKLGATHVNCWDVNLPNCACDRAWTWGSLNVLIWSDDNKLIIDETWFAVKFCKVILGNVWIKVLNLVSTFKLFNPIPEKLVVFPNLSNKVNISVGEKLFNVVWSIFTICNGVKTFNWADDNLLINAWKFVLSGLILPNLVEGNENLSNIVANWISVNKLIVVWSNATNLSGVICNSAWHIWGNAAFIWELVNLFKKFVKPLTS